MHCIILSVCCILYNLFSSIREVPDNQEVFAHSSHDQSIIIELVEYQNVADDKAAMYVKSTFQLVVVVTTMLVYESMVKGGSYDNIELLT